MREPYGEVVELDIQWNTKSVFVWNNFIKEYLWDHEEIDRSHYIEFIDGKFVTLEKGCCRKCGKKITSYTTKYYQPHFENGMQYCFLFCADNFYCEECAKKEAAKVFVTNCLPELVRTYRELRDGSFIEIREYADGSIIEDMTFDEIMRERARIGA